MNKTPLFKLNDGNEFPLVGFGTFRIHGQQKITFVVDEALKIGYRSFDTAAVYGNESAIGIALKELLPKYNLTREEIYITSKLSPSDQGGGDRTENAVKSSINKLQCGYLDLYLIHWPGTSRLDVSDKDNVKLRNESWQSLMKLKKTGLLKSIGVSNYNVRHIRELMNTSGFPPAVNQVEWHPHYHQDSLLAECRSHGILLQAYSSLGGTGNKALLNDSAVNRIAKKLGVSATQLLLKWPLQQNIAIIPKAESANHIRENILLDFVIPEGDMHLLSNLNVEHKYAWNPDTVV